MQDYGLDVNTELPEILTEARLAARMPVKADGLGRMTREGTLPTPMARDGQKALWLASDVEKWFSTLQPTQAAYASIDPGLGQTELLNQGIYVCPARDYRFIGQRRPVQVVLYKSKQPKNANGTSTVEVYDVEFVQTQAGVMGESLAWRAGEPKPQPVPWSTIRPGDLTPHTVFKLSLSSVRTLEVGRAWQRGGTISTESLRTALDHGYSSGFSGGVAH